MPKRPSREEIPEGMVPCQFCPGKCCRYFALPIDTPESWREYDFMRWFLLHERASVFVDDGTWYLLVHTKCKFLDENTRRELDSRFTLIYTGQRYESRANILENWAPPWFTHDMSLSRTIGRWRITAEINNIFNQQYEVVQCYPMPGTNFKIKLNWTL